MVAFRLAGPGVAGGGAGCPARGDAPSLTEARSVRVCASHGSCDVSLVLPAARLSSASRKETTCVCTEPTLVPSGFAGISVPEVVRGGADVGRRGDPGGGGPGRGGAASTGRVRAAGAGAGLLLLRSCVSVKRSNRENVSASLEKAGFTREVLGRLPGPSGWGRDPRPSRPRKGSRAGNARAGRTRGYSRVDARTRCVGDTCVHVTYSQRALLAMWRRARRVGDTCVHV